MTWAYNRAGIVAEVSWRSALRLLDLSKHKFSHEETTPMFWHDERYGVCVRRFNFMKAMLTAHFALSTI